MHAQTKLARKQKTLILLQSMPEGEGVSIYDIAKELDCDPSTVHRYLKEISDEYQLIEEGRGRYRIDPSVMLSNVRLYPSEALIIYLALRRFIRQTGKATKFMLDALQKIVPALNRADLKEMLNESVWALREERPASEHYTEIWNVLQDGWRYKRVIRIRYQKAGSEEADEHEIEPYLFEPMPFGDSIYLIAWSRTRNALRTFKPERILKAILTNEFFQPRQELTAETLLKHAWGIWYGEATTTVELLFAPEVARRVQETIYLPTEEKIPQPDGSLLWRAEVVGIVEILSWGRGWGPGVVVLNPPQLRQQIYEDLQKAIRLYDKE